jgi:two-component system, NtrC family, response regulator HydG
MISETLKFTRGDKRLAADLLGIATRTIYRKLESGFISEEGYRRANATAPQSGAAAPPHPDDTDGDGVLH